MGACVGGWVGVCVCVRARLFMCVVRVCVCKCFASASLKGRSEESASDLHAATLLCQTLLF